MMTMDGLDESGQESGGALREKLEATNAENRALKEALAATTASRFKYVSAEDLMDAAPNDLVERAQMLENERLEQRHALLNEELTARGLTPQQIAEIVGQSPVVTPTPAATSTSLGNVGNPPAKVKPGTEEGLFGPDRIRAALGG